MELLLNYKNKHNKEIEINFNKINESNNSFIFNVDPNLICDVMFSLGSFFSTNRVKNVNDKSIDFIYKKNEYNTNIEKKLIETYPKKYDFNYNKTKENIKIKTKNDTFLISEKYLKYKKNVFTIFEDGTFIKNNNKIKISNLKTNTYVSKSDPIFEILKEYDSIDKNKEDLKLTNENIGILKGNFYIFVNEFKSEMFIFNNISEDILTQELQIIKPADKGVLNITKILIANNAKYKSLIEKNILRVGKRNLNNIKLTDYKTGEINNQKIHLENILKINKIEKEPVIFKKIKIERKNYKQTLILKTIDSNRISTNEVSIKGNKNIEELNNKIIYLNEKCVIERERYKKILDFKYDTFEINNKDVAETKIGKLNKKSLQEILYKKYISIDDISIKIINEFKINSIKAKNEFTNICVIDTDKLEKKNKYDILNYSYNSLNKIGGRSARIEDIEIIKRKLNDNVNIIKFNSFTKYGNNEMKIIKNYSVLKSKLNNLLYLNIKPLEKNNRNELTKTDLSSFKRKYNNNMYVSKISNITNKHDNDMNIINNESLINIYNNKMSILGYSSLDKLNNNNLNLSKKTSLDKNKKYFLNSFSVLSLENGKKQNLNKIKFIEASHKDEFLLNLNSLITVENEYGNNISIIDFKSINNSYDRNVQLYNISSSNKKWKPLNDFYFESLSRKKEKIINAKKIAGIEKMYLDNFNIDYQESLTKKHLNSLNILKFNHMERKKYTTAIIDITERIEKFHLDSLVIDKFISIIDISGRNTMIDKFEKVNRKNNGLLNIFKESTINRKDNGDLAIDSLESAVAKISGSLNILNFNNVYKLNSNKLYIKDNETINKSNSNILKIYEKINMKNKNNRTTNLIDNLYIEKNNSNLRLDNFLSINKSKNNILNILYDNLNIFKIPDYNIKLDDKRPLLTKENKKIELFNLEKIDTEKYEMIIYDKTDGMTKEKYSITKFSDKYKLTASSKEINNYQKNIMLKSENKNLEKYEVNTILDFKNKINLKVKSEEIFLNKMPKSMMLYYNQKTVTKNSIKDLNEYGSLKFVWHDKKDILMNLETIIFDAKNNRKLKITSGKNAYDKRSLDTISENKNVIYQKIKNNFCIFDLYSIKKASNKNIMLDEDIEVLDGKILNITFFSEMKKLNSESKKIEIYNKTEIEKVYKNKNFSLNTLKIISDKKENDLKEYNNLTLESFGKNYEIYNSPLRIYSNDKELRIIEEIKSLENDFKSLNKIKEFELLDITLEGTDINVEDLKNLLSEKKYKSILMNIDIFVENSMPDGYNKFFRNITDDGFDELLLPKTDFDYSNFLSKVLDDEGNPIDPIRETDDGEFIVKMPISHPLENVYEDVQKEFLLVDVSILKYMIEATYYIWKENIFVFGATDMKASIIDLMDRLNKVVMFKIPVDLKPQAYRVLRLIRWYAEAAIINNAEYKVIREYTESKSAMYNGKLNLEHEKENLYVNNQLYMLSLINRSEDASLTLNIENHKDGYVTFGYQKTSSGILKILLNDVLITDYKDENSKIEIFVEKGSNILKIEFINNESDSIFRIANIITPFTKFVNARTEYIADRSKGNLVIDEMLKKASIYTNVLDDNAEFVNQLIEGNIAIGDLIDRLINYYNKHHLGKKTKGKRKVIKK